MNFFKFIEEFSFNNYKIWENHKAKIEIITLNFYGNLMALLDSEKQLFIYDLISKKSFISFNLLNIFTQNQIENYKDFVVKSLQFSKNSSFLGVIFEENSKVLLLNLTSSVTINTIYDSHEKITKVLLDKNNKYLFLVCSNTAVYLKYFRNLGYNLKILDFFEEENNENKLEIEYLTKFCNNREKFIIVSRKKTLNFLRFSFEKEKNVISHEKVQKILVFEMNLNSFTDKIIFNEDFERMVLIGNNKLEANYQIKYNMNENQMNSIEIHQIDQVFI